MTCVVELSQQFWSHGVVRFFLFVYLVNLLLFLLYFYSFQVYYAYHLFRGGLLLLFLGVTVFILSIVMCDCHLMCSL